MPASSALTRFVFRADGVKLSELPLDRVGRYVSLLADLMGHAGKVHLTSVTESSAVFAMVAEWAVVPQIRDRLAEARRPDGGRARARWQALDQALAEDGATGTLSEERAEGVVIPFPGVAARVDALPAFWQPSELRGKLVELRGRDGTKHGVILSATGAARFDCPEALALELRAHLFEHVRLSGRGRWQRGGDGSWRLLKFEAAAFDVLRGDRIADMAAAFRAAGGLGLNSDVHDVLGALR